MRRLSRETYHTVLPVLLFVGYIITPFVFWLTAPVAYEVPRVWSTLLWIQILALVTVITQRAHIFNSASLARIKLVLLFFAIAALAGLLGADPEKSFWGNYYRADGLLTLTHLILFAFVLSTTWKDSWKWWLANSIAIGSAAISIWVVVVGFNQSGLEILTLIVEPPQIAVSFGNPKLLAGYLLVTLPFLLYQIKASKMTFSKFLWCIAITTQLTALWFTGSKAAYLGMLLFLFGLALLVRSVWLKRVGVIAALCTIVAAGILFILSYQAYRKPHFITAETHERIVVKGLLAVAKRPLLGWGWANFDHAFAAADWPYRFEVDAYVDKAHGNFLEVLVTTGIIGFTIYGYLIWTVTKKLLKKTDLWHQMLLFTLLLYLFHSQTNVTSIAEELVFWMIVGITDVTKEKLVPGGTKNAKRA
ncbi:O-antigen ligase family protein [Candidatus Gottesmanbacteria bacterium]|nr:O-antigen ligase family protein [Candidatus Gottesmanbacteria bacterium]